MTTMSAVKGNERRPRDAAGSTGLAVRIGSVMRTHRGLGDDADRQNSTSRVRLIPVVQGGVIVRPVYPYRCSPLPSVFVQRQLESQHPQSS
jgi:hypothetical protein